MGAARTHRQAKLHVVRPAGMLSSSSSSSSASAAAFGSAAASTAAFTASTAAFTASATLELCKQLVVPLESQSAVDWRRCHEVPFVPERRNDGRDVCV